MPVSKEIYGAITVERAIPRKGTGVADYQVEVYRAKQVYGYTKEYGEEYLWLTTLFVPTPPGPGPSAITRGGLEPGEVAQAIDAFTGLTQLNVLAGWDYLLKEFWVSFDQPVRMDFYQGANYDDLSCIAYFEPFAKPTNVFQVGWTRSLLEDIALPSVLRCDVTNLGSSTAFGKVWVIGYRKEGSYIWV